MNGEYNSPVSLKQLQIRDGFWENEMKLVRQEILPYQWRALNDEVEGAEPSFCMRNFKVAGKLNEKRRKMMDSFVEPIYTFRGFESLPEDMEHLEDKFYGFVFQDSDFYKWIEAVGYSLAQHPDAELEKIADEAIDIVCKAQQEDGYLNTYYNINGRDKTFSNLRDHHELYCFGHLVEGAVAYSQATGKTKLLKAAERYADFIDQYFGAAEGKCKGYPGHEIAEMALARLYEITGEKRYLNLSKFFIDQRGTKPYYFDEEHQESLKTGKKDEMRYAYHQAHLPVRQQDEAVGHAVRAVYLYSGMADIARLIEDPKLYEACERLWEDIVNKKMYITGGIGGTHIREAFSFSYDLPNDSAYAETCASIGLVFFARRMLQIKPDAKYANVMERAIYNGVLSGMALDGKSFFYVNPLEVFPEACHKDERKAHVKPVRQKWFGCACCPPNLARLLSSIGTYAYTESESILFIHLYIGGIVEKQINGQAAQIHIDSGFPWDGNVRVSVDGVKDTFTIALRIPNWCANYQLEGQKDAVIEEKNGYLYVTKVWEEGGELTLHFPMEVRLIEANPFVRENIGKAAVMRGPVVYCLEEADNGKNLHLLSIEKGAEIEVEDAEIAGVPVKTVVGEGSRLLLEQEKINGLYHTAGSWKKETVRLRFVPYYTWANRGENEMQVWTRVEGGI